MFSILTGLEERKKESRETLRYELELLSNYIRLTLRYELELLSNYIRLYESITSLAAIKHVPLFLVTRRHFSNRC